MNPTASRIARRLLALLPAFPIAASAGLPIQIDGDFADWTAPPFATDPAGDAGTSGIDFTRLEIANDETRLFLRFDTTAEVQPDERQDIVIALDTDMDAATGAIVGSIGADLYWNLGLRSGTFFANGVAHAVGQGALGLFVGPTVSGTQFEIAFDRAAVPAAAAPLFPGDRFRLVLFDANATGDLLDASAVPYVFDATPHPVPSLGFARSAPGDVRIAAYNVENDGLFAGGARAAALDRLLRAIDADVWVISEVWGHGAPEVAARLESALPSAPGESWHAVKRDAGNVVASRLPIHASWPVLPGSRLTAVLLDARPALDSALLVVANHWSCCTADAARQTQADALVAFLADARTPGGALDLEPGTPIVAAGDFNLVGWRRQLDTVITGDIADNAAFGPDSPPDWDGTDFDVVTPRHPDARLTATWWSPAASFYPGRLDWIFYTGSVLEPRHGFVAETRSMTAANLAAHGLLPGDTAVASDHAPLVADFRRRHVAIPQPPPPASESRTHLDPVAPNPFRDAATIRWSLSARRPYRVTVHDVTGRLVRVLQEGVGGPGPGVASWDGRDAASRTVAAGTYFFRLHADGRTLARSAVIVR